MKKPPFPTKEDLVTGWIELELASENSPDWEESFWSHMLLDELVNDFPDAAFEVVLMILAADASTPVIGAVAAGPVEDLLAQHGSEFIERIEAEATRSPKFSSMLGGGLEELNRAGYLGSSDGGLGSTWLGRHSRLDRKQSKAMQLSLDPDIVIDEFCRESIILPSFGFCCEGS